jgi:thiol-disulfide isomerase/thioredoxin
MMKHFVILLIVGLGLSAAALAQDSMMSAPEESDGSKMMMSAEPAAPMGGQVMFTDLEAAQMLAARGPTVLFFTADWCPICRAARKELDAEAARLGDVTVVLVDYDRSAALKRKYGVSYQHTYVQIDAEGNKLTLWSGGGIDGVLKNVVRR